LGRPSGELALILSLLPSKRVLTAVSVLAALLALSTGVAKGKASRARTPPRTKAAKPALPRPWVATLRALEVSGSGATLRGRVNPLGRRTAYWFQYGTTRRYGRHTSTWTTRSVRRLLPISVRLSRLGALTTYHYRLVASLCRGCRQATAYGHDTVLTTTGYVNPLFGRAPDPFVLDNNGTHNDYWAFTTGNGFPILHSSDLLHWTPVGHALTQRPAWTSRAPDWHPWAPDVVNARESCPGTTSPSCYVMYYTALSAQFNINCVALATATTPAGPFIDQGPLSDGRVDAAGRPIGCGDNNGYGMIDPSLFVDPRTGQHLLYSSEDFACPVGGAFCTGANSTLRPTISVLPISSDFLNAAGARMPLFSGQAGSWEANTDSVPTVEDPSVLYHRGYYYLLYSGGNWRADYAVGYALAASPTGPFVKGGNNPIVKQTPSALSAGGGEAPVVGPHRGLWYVYHARSGSYDNPRTLRLDSFSWRPVTPNIDVPAIGAPTATPQPAQP